MTLKLALAVALLISFSAAFPAEEWNRTFGGPYSDGGWAFDDTSDGGAIIVGQISTSQGADLLLLKVGASGNREWDQSYGGSDDDLGYGVQETSDGYVVVGTTGSFGVGEERLWLLKTDGGGRKLWDVTLGGFVSSEGDGGWSVQQLGDGYLVVGYTRSFAAGERDLWMVKTDLWGKKQWSRSFGGQRDDVGFSLLPWDIGGYLASGYTSNEETGQDLYLVAVDGQGTLLWNQSYGGQGNQAAFSQARTREGGVVLTGRTDSGRGDHDVLLMKLNFSRQPDWTRSYGDEGNEVGLSVAATSDGGYLVCGRTSSTPRGDQDLLLLKTDFSGDLQWKLNLGGPEDDIGTAVMETADGYLVLGVTSSFGSGSEDIWLLKLKEVQETAYDVVRGALNEALDIDLRENVSPLNASPAAMPDWIGAGENSTSAVTPGALIPLPSQEAEGQGEGGVLGPGQVSPAGNGSKEVKVPQVEFVWQKRMFDRPTNPPRALEKFFKS
ncbi:MAG: hypothetical protein GKC10_08430 [Methanosarcinales archaeon]|nr:hypothetical protein [Methanosarcinales archaeon]